MGSSRNEQNTDQSGDFDSVNASGRCGYRARPGDPSSARRDAAADDCDQDRDRQHRGQRGCGDNGRAIGGDGIALTKNDADAEGKHHSIPSRWIQTVDDKVTIRKRAQQAMGHWREEARMGDDETTTGGARQGFSGSYRSPAQRMTKGPGASRRGRFCVACRNASRLGSRSKS